MTFRLPKSPKGPKFGGWHLSSLDAFAAGAEDVATRAEGAGRVVAAIPVAIASEAACDTVVGASVGGPGLVWVADQGKTGLQELWTGQRQQTVGSQVISSLAGNGTLGTTLNIAYDAGPPMFVGVYGALPLESSAAPNSLAQGSEYVVADSAKASEVNGALRDFYMEHCETPSIGYTKLPNCNGIINPETGAIQLDESLLGQYQHLHDGALNEEFWHFYQLKTQGLLGTTLTPAQVQELETGVKPLILGSGFQEVP